MSTLKVNNILSHSGDIVTVSNMTGSFSGSFFGDGSGLTGISGGGGSGAGFPFSGSAVITGSLYVTGSTISGSFAGDGSQLTGITSSITEVATVTDTYSNTTTKSVAHNFGTRNVVVQVYDQDFNVVIPQGISLPDTNTATVTFSTLATGTVVVVKGGHVVQGTASSGNTYKAAISGSSAYTITHGLSEEFPLVQFYDNVTKQQVLPQTITSVDANQVSITFSTTFAGNVIVKK